MPSCLSRSKAYIKSLGGIVEKTEHWNQFARKRQDLFGLFDLVWLSMSTDHEDGQVVGVQVVNTHLEDHLVKINKNPIAKMWVTCGAGFEIHDWRKQTSKGRTVRWNLSIIEWNPYLTIKELLGAKGKVSQI